MEENILMKSLGLFSSEEPKEEEPADDAPTPVDADDSDSKYDVVPDPQAEQVDLSALRGVANNDDHKNELDEDPNKDTDLENLAEIVPDIKQRRRSNEDGELIELPEDGAGRPPNAAATAAAMKHRSTRKLSLATGTDEGVDNESRPYNSSNNKSGKQPVERVDSMKALESRDRDDNSRNLLPADLNDDAYQGGGDESSNRGAGALDDYPDSDHVLDDDEFAEDEGKINKEFVNMRNMSDSNSISTATQTHEVRMPMYLPTFKPATGCTNASDFIVRCFIARLRSGITVVKHGRSRWCKSRLRVLHIHPDGRSLSWKPAEGEPNSSKRPPKLDLSTCLEVRHAWSPDPQNPMYTGTPILRQKCEAANAHKSFALIFKQRTVDITAVTADQCKVLMEGFSALCFRLQVATLAGRGGKKGQAMPEEDGVSTTASATLTNSSTPRVR